MRVYANRQEALPQQILLSDSQEEQGIPPADLKLAKDVSDVLMRHYPGHGWLVHADHHQGIVQIALPGLPNHTIEQRAAGQYSAVVHIAHLKTDPTMREVVRRAGELLEAWRLRRGPLDRAAFNDATPDEAAFPLIARARARARAMVAQSAKLLGPDGLPIRKK